MLTTIKKGLGVIGLLAIGIFMADWVINQPMLKTSALAVNMFCLGLIFLLSYIISSGGIFLSMLTNTKIDRVANWATIFLFFAICAIYLQGLVETAYTSFSVYARFGFLVVIPVIALIDAFTKPKM